MEEMKKMYKTKGEEIIIIQKFDYCIGTACIHGDVHVYMQSEPEDWVTAGLNYICTCVRAC